MLPNTFPVILKEAFSISPHVKHFVFQPNPDHPFTYLPGQFITIHFEVDGKALKRSYSIANAPEEGATIEFAAGYVEGGPGTQLLFNLQPGDAINISGPFGRLIFKEEQPKRYIFVATSTGITPYRAMLNEMRRRINAEPSLRIVILQGVQYREDVLYGDEFLALAAAFPQVTFQAHLSRQGTEDLQPHEYTGYVQDAFTNLNLNPAEDLVYLCGNPQMIDDAFEQLKNGGFATQHVIREKYISR